MSLRPRLAPVALALVLAAACTTSSTHAPASPTASGSARPPTTPVPSDSPRELALQPRPQVVVQVRPAGGHGLARIRTPQRDWQLEWGSSYGKALLVRDAATSDVLYEFDRALVVGASADPDRGVLCAVIAEYAPSTAWKPVPSQLFAIGWDLGGARELWRRPLPPSATKGTLSFFRALVVGDRCLLIGKEQQQMSLRLHDGEVDGLAPSPARRSAIFAHGHVDVFPADDLMVVRSAAGYQPQGAMVLGIADARPRRWTPTTCTTIADGRIVSDSERFYRLHEDVPPIAPPVIDPAACAQTQPAPVDATRPVRAHSHNDHGWATRGAIWHQNQDGISMQRLDAFGLPAVVAPPPPGGGTCRAVSVERTACVDAVHETLVLLDGDRYTTPTPLPTGCRGHRDVYEAALGPDGQLAMRCGTRLFLGRAGARLREVRGMGFAELGHQLITWVAIDGASRLLVSDARAGTMLLDETGRTLWRRAEPTRHTQLGPDGTVFSLVGDRGVFADLATGEDRGGLHLPLAFSYNAAVVGKELRGRINMGASVRIQPTGDGWKATRRFHVPGMVQMARVKHDAGLLLFTGWDPASSIADVDGNFLATTEVVPGGAYVYGADGTFACRGAGCALLRCTVDGQSRPVDDPACASLRRDRLRLPTH